MLAYWQALVNEAGNESSCWPLPSFDARDWAEAFCKLHPEIDVELMVTWFANALMRGYDEVTIQLLRSTKDAKDALENIYNQAKRLS